MNDQPQPQRKMIPTQFRGDQVYLSRSTAMGLRSVASVLNTLELAKAKQAGTVIEANLTADALAEQVLAEWLFANFPGLDKFEREVADTNMRRTEYIREAAQGKDLP